MANCIQCSGEGKTNLWRFGNPGRNVGCEYSSFNSCLESNNPKNINVTTDCLVFLNDGGPDIHNAPSIVMSNSLFLNKYSDPNQQKPIPSQYATPTSPNYIEPSQDQRELGVKKGRLWGYDFSANTTYYLDSFNHRGSDIAVTKNRMFVGCEYNSVSIPGSSSPSVYTTIPGYTINEYSYSITNNDPDTFTKTPLKTYRFVNKYGDILALNWSNTAQQSTNPWTDWQQIKELDGLGNDLGIVDDRTIIFSDKQGHMYVAQLDNLWSGESVTYGSTNGVIGSQGGTLPSGGPNGPIDLSGHDYGLATQNVSSPGTPWHWSYTDALYSCSEDSNYQVHTVVAQLIVDFHDIANKTMGDVLFIPSDSVNGGNPSIIVTILKHTGAKVFVRWPYPTNLNNITVKYWGDKLTEHSAPSGAVALFKNTGTGQFYTVAARKRYDIDFTTLAYSNSLSTQITTYDNAGFLQTIDAGPLWGWGWRGASQPVDCISAAAYTYNCTIDGCVSVLGALGTFPNLPACTASCVSWSCTTTCDCPDGYTYNNITENCEITTNPVVTTSLLLTNAGNSSQYNNNVTYFYQKQGVNWNQITTKSGPTLATVNDASGFWGMTGDYLLNSPLNAWGLWNPTFQSWTPTSQNWYGTSKCITVDLTPKAYLIGIGSTEHFRIAVNNIIEVDTTTGINNFDPGNVLGGNDPVTQPPLSTFQSWHVFKVVLQPGDNTILLEGASTGNIATPAFAFDIVGPFTSADYDTAVEYQALTTNVYTANTIYSTKNLSEIIGSDNCNPTTTPAFPLIMGSTMYTTYPDPWRSSTAADETIDLSKVLSQGLPPGHVPGWGLINNDTSASAPGDSDSSWALDQWQTGFIPWLAAGGSYTNPITNTSSLRRNINCVYDFTYPQEMWNNISTFSLNSGLAAANPGTTNQTFAGGTITVSNYMPSGTVLDLFVCDHVGMSTTMQNNQPGVYTMGECCDGGSLYGISGVYGPVSMTLASATPTSINPGTAGFHIGPFNNYWSNPGQWNAERHILGSGGNVQCDGCTTGQLGYMLGFQTWTDAIDFLNSQGLTVSPIIDPTTGQSALIDYNADYWTVLRAVQTYWTPATPQPPGSTGVLRTINGIATCPVSIMTWGNQSCRCDSTSGVFNTQVNYCESPTIYDSCADVCVGTTACTLNYALGFSGGCVSIEGTGATNTYLTLGDCERDCFSGFTYWECGNNGCSTAASGIITPYTSQTDCELVCTSYSCSTAGCDLYNSGGGLGTGGTFTDLNSCDISCKSWNCTNGFAGSGCQQQIGTGGTYTQLSACTGTCVSYECLSYGCWGYEGTGYTYTTLAACTATCQTHECTYSGCGFFNPPPVGTVITPGIGNPNTYYGTGTSTTPNLYTSNVLCVESCHSWGCAEYELFTSSRQPNIYVYYDTTSMSVDISQSVEALSAWTQSIPGYTGRTYHTLIGNERWLQWGTAPWDAFSGLTSQSLTAYGGQAQSLSLKQWALGQGIYTYPDGTNLIFDGRPTGATIGTGQDGNGNVVYIHGTLFAPQAAVNENVITIVFCDESMGGGGTQAHYTDTPTSYDYNNPYWVTVPQGKWQEDYNSIKGRWTAGEANGATNQWLLYGATYAPNQTTSNVSQFAQHAIAAIFSGNTGNNDGLWLPGTAPNNVTSPNFCSVLGIPSSSLLEVSNPYVGEGVGLLEHYGWKMNYAFNSWNPSGFQSYLSTGVFGSTQVVNNSGCFSAATLPTEAFPFSSQTDCNSGFTYWNGELVRCSGFRCTNTGCILVTGTTNTDWQYETLAQCTAACQSYLCTTTGCTTYNLPYYGTGGTFNSLINCSSGCSSYNCGTWNPMYGPAMTWDGCIPQIGTGGTFYDSNHLTVGSLASYSACTGSCISYSCTGACETTGTLGAAGYTANTGTCITWPNTGGTYTTLSACTANCQTFWWCVPETIIDTCDNRTLQTLGIVTVDNIGNANYYGNVIAAQYPYTNISTLSFESSSLGFTVPNQCTGPNGLPLIGPLSIQSTHIPGGPWYTWSDFITAVQAQGISVTLADTYFSVHQAVQAHYQLLGTAFWMDNIHCVCTTTFNNVTCTTNPLPPTIGATGPFATSGEALSNCYNTSWNCVDETFTNTCSGTTQLPIIYSSLTDVHNYVSTNLPNLNLADISYESNDLQTLTNGCVGPNGYALYKLQPLSYSLLNNGTDYQTYNSFVTALSGEGATTLVPGMLYSTINSYINTISGSPISLCQEPCICDTTPCYCEEIIGTGGTYTSLSLCELNCTCIPTGTSWNCVHNGPYQPTCNNKPYMGEYYSQNDVVDFFRQNDPNLSFGTKRFTYNIQSFNPLVNGPILHYTLGTPSVWGLFSASTYQWDDCYKYKVPDLFYPFTYIKSISHPLISGGTGTLTNAGWTYNNWSSFYNAVSNAGVSINTTMPFSSVCDTIDITLASSAPAGGILQGCNIDFAYCCVDEACYCYELFVTGGTFTNEPDCLSKCCPPRNRTGYTCDSILQTCVVAGPPVPPSAYILHPTWAACIAALPKECPPIMWDCITGTTTYACDPSQPIDQVSPGTLGGNGTPFIVNNPGYPFTSFTTTAAQFGVFNGIGHAEQVLTNPTYLDPSVPFSSVTYEISGTTNNPFIAPCNPACLGPHGWPVRRMISIGHPQLNGGQQYYTWGDFVSAANTAGFPYPTTLPIQEWGWSHWTVIVEICDCTPDDCYCEEVVGVGQYWTQAACEKVCCDPEESWDCTITGCVDPGTGNGAFFGLNGLTDCINVCKEYECNPGLIMVDTCDQRQEIPYNGTGSADIMMHISDNANGLQSTLFSDMKFEIANYCHPPQHQPCYGQNGLSLAYVSMVQKLLGNSLYGIPAGEQFYSWTQLIDGINQYCNNCTGTFTVNSVLQTTQTGSMGVNCLDGSNVCFYDMTVIQPPVAYPEFSIVMGCCSCSGSTCDCLPIVGTGHSGTYVYTPPGYSLCVSACCDEQNYELCDVFLSVKDRGVFHLDVAGTITEALPLASTVTDYDITMYIDGPLNSYMWLYDNNIIREYTITLSPWTVTFNRNINTLGFIGRGLTTYDETTLISADNWVRMIDITPPAPNANITLLFQLPGWCLGDIIWDPTSQQFLIAYSSLPPTATTQKIGKFNYTGTLQDEYLIPGGVLLQNEKIDGLFMRGGTNNSCRNYAVTNLGRVFDILDPLMGSLSLSPVPNVTILDGGIQSNNTPVTGAANAQGPAGITENCGCIRKRPTYNCEYDVTAIPPTSSCIDPGDGSGTYTPITAALNGYASALLECEDNCPFSCITWDCVDGTQINTCADVNYILPYPQVNSDGTALYYISDGNWPNSHLTPFSDIKFQVPQQIVDACLGPNGHPYIRISYLVSPWDGTHYYTWGELIDALNMVFNLPAWLFPGFGYHWNLAQITQVLDHLGYGTPEVVTEPCVCTGTPCHCVPVLGFTGQYSSESLCITKCCPTDPVEEGYMCEMLPGAGGTCMPCIGPGCQFTTTQAIINGYANALAWCQDVCWDPVPEGWICEVPGTPCVSCPNPTPNGPCYTNPHDCLFHCGDESENPCPPIDANSPFYTNPIEFCENCGPGGYYHGHVDCPCCDNPVLLGTQMRYCGPEEEVAVKISEYTGTKLKVVISEMVNALETLQAQSRRPGQKYDKSNCDKCGGTVETNATCLDSGCLSITSSSQGTTPNVCWTTSKERDQENKTYDCIKGSCMEIRNGRFTSMSSCIKECNDIKDGRSSRTLRGDKNRLLAPIEVTQQPTITTKKNKTVTLIESNFYMCQTKVNPVVSENQNACIPVETMLPGAFTSLEDCLNSGCGGWIIPITDNPINANGVKIKSKEISPIGMCCESYISKATAPLTLETCVNNCCDGNDTWFPLYNVNGLTNIISSPLSYTKSQISHLLTSKVAEISKNKTPYIRKGYKLHRPYTVNQITQCGGEIVGYVDNIPVYATIAKAVEQASSYNCEGYHEHTINGIRGYMPCQSHPVAKVGYTGNELEYKEPQVLTDTSSCCPETNRPGYSSAWVSINPCGGVHAYTGIPTVGTNCGFPPGWQPQINNPLDPLWCCEWDIITGSDRALKHNIVKVGKSPTGINIYEFEYKDKSFGEGRFRGVIAQEVPHASHRKDDGYLYVNYSQIDVSFEKVK